MDIHFKVNRNSSYIKKKVTYSDLIDLTEHALYVAVKDHRTRPPLGKLSQIYPHQLLVLLMEMWEGESQLVNNRYIFFFISSKKKNCVCSVLQ